MPSTLPIAAGLAEVRSSDRQSTLPMIGEARGPVGVDSPDGQWILPLIDRALDRTMQRKEAAFRMGMDVSLLKRQLSGDGHLSVKRLGALGGGFWSSLADELREHFALMDRSELIEQGEALIDRGRQLLARAAQR